MVLAAAVAWWTLRSVRPHALGAGEEEAEGPVAGAAPAAELVAAG
jgi:hypothetical protein